MNERQALDSEQFAFGKIHSTFRLTRSAHPVPHCQG